MDRYRWLLLVPLVIGVAIGVAYFALLFIVQRSMLFPMPSEVPSLAPAGAEEVRVRFDGGEAYALFLAPGSPQGKAPLLMFMHGNGELADYWTGEFNEPRALGIAV